MKIVMVPGLWLNASTFDEVVPVLAEAGHEPVPLTLPGMESVESDRSGITLEDHVATVAAVLEAADDPVLLVAHSAGCGIGHAALDHHPDRVAHVVHVGGFPVADGESLLSGLEAVDGEVAMPDWAEVGEEANIVDFTPEQLTALYAEAIPVPERVVSDPVRLGDPRRHGIPATYLCPEYTAADLRSWVDEGELPEVGAQHSVEYVDLGGGHWPQITQPAALAAAILATLPE
ncbi:alpha/beta hydrolase [Mumia sp. DW29H23]|uniref:alpha/beta hydrolase n=1 Tax=Mumia sp. DW29H23 TaxID=3421241 RepID=UPI003D68F090